MPSLTYLPNFLEFEHISHKLPSTISLHSYFATRGGERGGDFSWIENVCSKVLGTPQLRDVEKPLGGCLWWPQEVCPSGSQWHQQEAVAVRGPSAGPLLQMAFLPLPLDPGQPAGSPSTGNTATQPTDDGLPALGSAISGLLGG